MSIKADTKYYGVVAPGSQLYETQTGTLGYQVMLECPDGPTSFVIWLTQKNRERARRYCEVLGVDPELLKDSRLHRVSARPRHRRPRAFLRHEGRRVQRQAQREGGLDRRTVGPEPVAERRPFLRRSRWRWRHSW